MSARPTLRILHLPVNIASQITVTVRALRDIGVQARGLAPQGVVTSNSVIEPLPELKFKQRSRVVPALIALMAKMVQAVRWADVIHWHYGWALPRGLDLSLAKRYRRKMFVEFWGSDIRIPEVEAADNPYYSEAFPTLEYRNIESYAGSRRRQMRFARAGAEPMACVSMFPYIQRDLFPQPRFVRQRVYMADYEPCYPDVGRRPVVIHSPTAPVTKGTAAVEAAVAQLQPRLAFDYRRVQGVPHHEARRIMQSCDIFVDQLVIGAHGLAALEAMAFGKPVVCYIKPAMVPQYPPDLPIVIATKETLPEVLARLVENGALRRELGQRGRAYVEKYHDAHIIARQLVEIYEGLPR